MATFTSTTSGNFNNGATWGNANPGVVGVDFPGSGDSFTVSSGHTVTIVSDLSSTVFKSANINGILRHSTAANSKIVFGTTVPFMTFGASGKYQIGTSASPIPIGFTAALETQYTGTAAWFAIDPSNTNCFEANGAFPSGVSQYNSTLAGAVSASATSFTTTHVIGPASGSFEVLLDWTDGTVTHWEIVTVSAYNQGTKVATCSALQYAHASGCRVWNLGRNVTVKGGSSNGGTMRVNWNGNTTPLNVKHVAFQNFYSLEASQYHTNATTFTYASSGTFDHCVFRNYRALGVKFEGIKIANSVMVNVYQGTGLHCGSQRQITESIDLYGITNGSYGLQAYEPFPGAYAKSIYISGGDTTSASATSVGLAYVGAVYIDGCTVRGLGYGREDNFFYGNGKYKRNITFANLLNANHLGTFNSGFDEAFSEYGTEFIYESTLDTTKAYIDRSNSDSFQNTFGFKYMDYAGVKGDFLFVYEGGIVQSDHTNFQTADPAVTFTHQSVNSPLYYRVPVQVTSGVSKNIQVIVRKSASGFITRPTIGFCEAGKDPNMFTQGGFSYISQTTMADTTNTWETLTLTFTPTFTGIGWLYMFSKSASGTVNWSDPNY